MKALLALPGGHRGSWSPSCPHAHPGAWAPPVPPASAQVAPVGSLPHTRASLQLPGVGAQPQWSPWSQNPRVCNRDRKNQEEKPGFSYPQGQEGRWQLVLFHRRAEFPQAPPGHARAPLFSSPLARQPYAPGCQRKRGAAQQQLPSTWAGTSGPHRVDCRSGSTMVSRSGDSI